MKNKILILAALCIASIGAHSQIKTTSSENMKVNIRGKVKQIVETIKYTKGGAVTTIYKFNPQGLVTNIERDNGSRGKGVSVFTYNADNSLAKKAATGGFQGGEILFEYPYYEPQEFKADDWGSNSQTGFEYKDGVLSLMWSTSGSDPYIIYYNPDGKTAKSQTYDRNNTNIVIREEVYQPDGSYIRSYVSGVNKGLTDTIPATPSPIVKYDTKGRFVSLRLDASDAIDVKYNLKGFVSQVKTMEHYGELKYSTVNYLNYVYDKHGNWIKRTQSGSYPATVTRVITYYM